MFLPANSPVSPVDRSRLLTAPSKTGCHVALSVTTTPRPASASTRDIARKSIEYPWRQAVPFVVTGTGQGGVVPR